MIFVTILSIYAIVTPVLTAVVNTLDVNDPFTIPACMSQALYDQDQIVDFKCVDYSDPELRFPQERCGAFCAKNKDSCNEFSNGFYEYLNSSLSLIKNGYFGKGFQKSIVLLFRLIKTVWPAGSGCFDTNIYTDNMGVRQNTLHEQFKTSFELGKDICIIYDVFNDRPSDPFECPTNLKTCDELLSSYHMNDAVKVCGTTKSCSLLKNDVINALETGIPYLDVRRNYTLAERAVGQFNLANFFFEFKNNFCPDTPE
jgi:hypothetical protein